MFRKLVTGHYQYVWSSQAALCQFWLIFLLSIDPKPEFEQTHLDLVKHWDSQHHKYGLEARGGCDNVDCLQIQLYLLHVCHLQVLQAEFCFLPFTHLLYNGYNRHLASCLTLECVKVSAPPEFGFSSEQLFLCREKHLVDWTKNSWWIKLKKVQDKSQNAIQRCVNASVC